MEYVVGAIVMWIVLAGLFTWYQETYNEVLEVIVALPLVVVIWTLVVLQFPFIVFWKFIRNAIKGVSQDVWDKAKLKHYKRIGNICFVYDEKARAFQNKFFMVRLISSKGKGFVHEPVIDPIEIVNTPSVPEGKFRIGEE